MFPWSAYTARDTARAAGASPSPSSTAERIFGPPGWAAHVATASGDSPLSASQASSHGRTCRAISPGTFRESVISNPWSPTVQPISASDSGIRHDPEAASCQGEDDPSPGPSPTRGGEEARACFSPFPTREGGWGVRSPHPTTAAAPSAKIALATSLSGSLP